LNDSLHSTEWTNIEKVRATVGLTDSTLEQLAQEDANFRRVNGNTVEYDLSKVYNHPAVQAFRTNVGRGKATMISYENIITGYLVGKQKS
jgi:hypothetical protein